MHTYIYIYHISISYMYMYMIVTGSDSLHGATTWNNPTPHGAWDPLPICLPGGPWRAFRQVIQISTNPGQPAKTICS